MRIDDYLEIMTLPPKVLEEVQNDKLLLPKDIDDTFLLLENTADKCLLFSQRIYNIYYDNKLVDEVLKELIVYYDEIHEMMKKIKDIELSIELWSKINKIVENLGQIIKDIPLVTDVRGGGNSKVWINKEEGSSFSDKEIYESFSILYSYFFKKSNKNENMVSPKSKIGQKLANLIRIITLILTQLIPNLIYYKKPFLLEILQSETDELWQLTSIIDIIFKKNFYEKELNIYKKGIGKLGSNSDYLKNGHTKLYGIMSVKKGVKEIKDFSDAINLKKEYRTPKLREFLI